MVAECRGTPPTQLRARGVGVAPRVCERGRSWRCGGWTDAVTAPLVCKQERVLAAGWQPDAVTPTCSRAGAVSVVAWRPDVVAHTPRSFASERGWRWRCAGGGVAGRCRTLVVASEKGWGPTKKGQKSRKMKMNEYAPYDMAAMPFSHTHPTDFRARGCGVWAGGRVLSHTSRLQAREGGE